MADRIFQYFYDGLKLEVTASDNGLGGVDLAIKCLDGFADINGIYWGDNSNDGTTYDLGKSLSLTGGTNLADWDGAFKVSDTGLGKLGTQTEKAGYLTEGETYYHTIDGFSLDDLENLGIRATSTSAVNPDGTAMGSIKGVQTGYWQDVHAWTFEDTIPAGEPFNGQFTQVVPNEWNGSTVEIQGGGPGINYGGHSNFGAGEQNYLDTAASPGNVTLTSDTVDVDTGNKVAIDITVAPQNLTYNNVDYHTAADASFDLVFNGQVVHHFTLADFDGDFTNLAFKNFHFEKDINGNDLVGVEDGDVITIQSSNPDPTYTGFSVDHIILNEWIV